MLPRGMVEVEELKLAARYTDGARAISAKSQCYQARMAGQALDSLGEMEIIGSQALVLRGTLNWW